MADVIRSGPVVVSGLRDLQRAFRAVSKDLAGGVKEALANASEPVRAEAQSRALTDISGLARSGWYSMRTGVTRSSVYVAPLRRGVAGSGREHMRRPKFGEKLLQEALEPALASNRDKVEDAILDELDELFRMWERI